MARKSARWTPSTVAIAVNGRAVLAPAASSPAKAPKYGNRKVKVDGVTWDSEGERARYVELASLQAAGHIAELRRSVPFVLAPAADVGEARKKPAIRYVADFTYTENGVLVVEDFKSPSTRANPVYRIKKHLMVTVHGVLIRETKRK